MEVCEHTDELARLRFLLAYNRACIMAYNMATARDMVLLRIAI
jgi:hypothetical protein